jgi:hypothetical protein
VVVFLTKRVVYSGVVVGYESISGYGDLLLVQGEVNGVNVEFYLKPGGDTLKRIRQLGIGVRVEGVGIIVSEDPLILVSQE